MAVNTIEEAIAQRNANVDYDRGTGNIAKCELYIEAQRILASSASRTSKGDESAEWERRNDLELLKRAEAWKAANAPTTSQGGRRVPRTTFADVSRWRY